MKCSAYFLLISLTCESFVKAGILHPHAIDISLIRYQLYTRRNPTYWQSIELGNLPSLQDSYFNPALNTKIYAPGWDNDGTIANGTRDGYLIQENCNFIIVDWKPVAFGNVARMLNVTLETGYHTAAFVDFLIANTGAPMESFHLMGHSAGAHVAGAAGRKVTKGKIPRITGLDPAGGGVWSVDRPDIGLDVTDTVFLDVMHTNGGPPSNGNAAIFEPMGHVDFYVNGGVKQPGCADLEFQCCSHCRAAHLFAESITTQVGFIALRCDSYEDYVSGACDGNDMELMGEHVSFKVRGTFYVKTNEEAPFACGLCVSNV